jgi:SET domain-containing protein
MPPTTLPLRERITLTQPWFEIHRSPIQGRGAFAVCSIPKGTRLIEYTGERIGHAVFAARSARESKGRHHTFFFQATRRTVVDARAHGNEAKYINHACDPNSRAVIEKGRIYIETLKAIRKGQELAYDYSFDPGEVRSAADAARYKCRCGAKKCRGSIVRPRTESGAVRA